MVIDLYRGPFVGLSVPTGYPLIKSVKQAFDRAFVEMGKAAKGGNEPSRQSAKTVRRLMVYPVALFHKSRETNGDEAWLSSAINLACRLQISQSIREADIDSFCMFSIRGAP